MVVGVGCSKSEIRAYEGHMCSTSSSDDPLLTCSPAYDLVCIATYTVMVLDPKEAAKFPNGLRPVYLCRLACSTNADCTQAGDICCNGTIHGKDYGKKAGCVPAGYCDEMRRLDGGLGPSPDTGATTPDAGAAPDTGAPDAPAGG
jgi:hypothetical protein